MIPYPRLNQRSVSIEHIIDKINISDENADASVHGVIDFMLFRMPLPAFYLHYNNDDRTYTVISDNEVVLATIKNYMKDKFALKTTYFDEFIKDKKFSELYRRDQEAIKDAMITIYDVELCGYKKNCDHTVEVIHQLF